MHSLTTKFTLAFLLIGVLGAGLVALLTTRSIRAEFDRFVNETSTEQIATRLETLYAENGGWDGIEEPTQEWVRGGQRVLLDADGNVVLGNPNAAMGRFASEVTLTVEEEHIGTLFMRVDPFGMQPNLFRPFSAEARFLNNMRQSAVVSGIIAATVALGVGVLLTRGLLRPIQALTTATHKMAAGEFGEQVVVQSRDEVGQLATAFNQMSHDLAAASQKRKQLTADIAHDLRTPLSILLGYMEGLKDGSLSGSPKIYDVMFAEAKHLEHLIKDLRTLSLAETGALSLNKRAVDPRALLERTGLTYAMQAQQQGVALRIDAPTQLPSVNVDTERIAQVLNNLVSNALHHTKSGEIVLRASAENGQIALQVRDTGQGISADALPHIFDRFYRSDASRQRNADGTVSSGLGLAIAHALVQAHGGHIRVESCTTAPKTGTTFTIQLPANPNNNQISSS